MFKNFFKALLYPHKIVVFLLCAATPVLLTISFIRPVPILNYIFYVISAYALTTLCFRIPSIVRFARRIKTQNGFVLRLQNDVQFQVNASLYTALAFNAVYAAFQLCLGLAYESLWYYSFSAYYILLAAVRVYLLKYTKTHESGADINKELKRYIFCGYTLLVMNISLSVIMFFIVAKGKSFEHNEIVTITIAAFTFTALTIAIINLIKFKRYKSPVFSASKIISLVAACVSMLTLESTMLSTFGSVGDAYMHKMMLGISGGAVSAFIVAFAIYIIIKGNKQSKKIT